jgi:hypothetical protein
VGQPATDCFLLQLIQLDRENTRRLSLSILLRRAYFRRDKDEDVHRRRLAYALAHQLAIELRDTMTPAPRQDT